MNQVTRLAEDQHIVLSGDGADIGLNAVFDATQCGFENLASRKDVALLEGVVGDKTIPGVIGLHCYPIMCYRVPQAHRRDGSAAGRAPRDGGVKSQHALAWAA